MGSSSPLRSRRDVRPISSTRRKFTKKLLWHLAKPLGGAGDEEDAHLVPPVAQRFGKLHAVDARHLDVQKQQIKGAAALLQGRVQGLGGGVGGHLPGDAPLLEDFPAKAFQALALPGVILADGQAVWFQKRLPFLHITPIYADYSTRKRKIQLPLSRKLFSTCFTLWEFGASGFPCPGWRRSAPAGRGCPPPGAPAWRGRAR